MKLRVRQAQRGHPCGPDGNVALARVLQEHDARRRLDGRDVAAVADALGPAAARADDPPRAGLGSRGTHASVRRAGFARHDFAVDGGHDDGVAAQLCGVGVAGNEAGVFGALDVQPREASTRRDLPNCRRLGRGGLLRPSRSHRGVSMNDCSDHPGSVAGSSVAGKPHAVNCLGRTNVSMAEMRPSGASVMTVMHTAT